MQELDGFLEEHRDRFLQELCELLRIPSVSTDSRHAEDVRSAAVWVAKQLEGLSLSTEVIETEGHPIVYAESPPVEGAPTVLVYGHYDVQPPEPMDEWITPPFQPDIRDGNVYARGATDDKGQMLTHIKSAEVWMRTKGSLPLQIKYLIEGEEEVGSANLYKYLAENKEQLACDIVVISDCSQFAPGQPAITYGLKGIAYFELRVTGPRQDLHSGTFGGSVMNPVNALCRILTALVDGDGHIQIPDFYDDVVGLTDPERRQFASLPFDERGFMEKLGVSELFGESGFSTLERRWARPTCDINGIWGGYQGEGEKTVLPAKATAKFSFRLVPKQDPHKVADQLEAFIAEICPPGVEAELVRMHGACGYVTSLDSPYVTAATKAIEQGFGRSPVFIREGGSIPIVTAFQEQLDVESLLLGWGLDDDNTHSPNEKFCLADFQRGIKASTYLWRELAKISND